MTKIKQFAAVLAAGIVLLFGASSCHKKNSQTETTVPGHEICPEPTDSLSPAPVVEETQAAPEFPASFGDWTSLEVPVQVSLTAPKSLSASGRLSMVKGRELLLSLRFIGFEVAQLYADADSVYAVEKIHKWYVAESIQRLGAGTGLTLADLQGYLLGRPTRAIPQLGGIEAVYDWNPSPGRLGAVGFYRNGLPAAGIAYEAAEQTPTGPTASGVDLAALLGKNEVAASISYRLQQAKWNSLGSISFKRPGRDYRRIEISQISKNI